MVEIIRAAGYDVYMRKPNDAYCYYTDGKNIGYAQWGRRESVTTVHIPNLATGTGYNVADVITPTTLREGFFSTPVWALGYGSVKKYANIEAFLKASTFNREFRKV